MQPIIPFLAKKRMGSSAGRGAPPGELALEFCGHKKPEAAQCIFICRFRFFAVPGQGRCTTRASRGSASSRFVKIKSLPIPG